MPSTGSVPAADNNSAAAEAATSTASAATASSSSSSSEPNPKMLWSSDLSAFLTRLDTYNPSFPEAAAHYYIERTGCRVIDERVPKLVALATDQYIAGIVHDAKQLSNLKAMKERVGKRKAEIETTLEFDEFERTLASRRIFLHRPKAHDGGSSRK